MNALTLGQWSAVGVLVSEHSTNPALIAAVDAELEQARRDTPATEQENTMPTREPVAIGDVLPDVLDQIAGRRE